MMPAAALALARDAVGHTVTVLFDDAGDCYERDAARKRRRIIVIGRCSEGLPTVLGWTFTS
jgi:hypothetical protein